MKTTYYIIAFLLLTAYSCGAGSRTEDAAARALPEPDISERLHHEKNRIDTLYRRYSDKLFLMAKPTVNGIPVPVGDHYMPQELHTMYEILTDSAGHMVSVSEFPLISGGEWNISYIHYFDKNGNTFAFERQTTFLNSRCTPGVAREVIAEFFNGSFQTVAREYELRDAQDQPLQKTDCVFPYNFIYQVSSDTSEYLQANKIRR